MGYSNFKFMIHDLKTWPDNFLQVVCGRKTFEIRKNDRDFKSHDILHLQEYNPETKEYTGQACSFKVTYILDLTDFGLPGSVAMAIVPWFLPSSHQNNKLDMPLVGMQSYPFTCKLKGGKDNCKYKSKDAIACVLLRQCKFASKQYTMDCGMLRAELETKTL